MPSITELLLNATSGHTLLGTRGEPTGRTAEELIRAARRFAAAAAPRVQTGDRVLLLISDIDDFFAAFWGVLLLGATPVPLAPARPGPDMERVRRVLDKTRGPVFVDRGVRPPFPAFDVGEYREGTEEHPGTSSDAPALIQFSSGSTGHPKGVVLTHAQLRANVEQLTDVPFRADDRLFVWMPHFHDMGLIGGHLLPLRIGMDVVRMDPLAAMRDPVGWLRRASETRCTVLSSTNFGLARVVARLGAEVPDLSRVRLVANGAEPISPQVCREFSRRTGVLESAHLFLYGMAEGAVGLAAARRGGIPTVTVDGREVAVIGPALTGVELRVIDGELQARGPNITNEYLEDPDATRAAFDDGWLRTGDLAVLVEGQLVITGRSKDVVVCNGRKLHAHDVEAAAEAVVGVRAGGALAFGEVGPAGVEGLAVGVVTGSAPVAVLRAVRERIAAEFGVESTVFALGDVPRTTSGKKQRARVRELRAAGTPVGPALAILSTLLPIDPDQPLAEAGLSSIQAVELLARLGEALGILLDHRLLLRAATVRELALQVDARVTQEAEEGREDAPSTTGSAPRSGASQEEEPLAIVAAVCRLPGSDTLTAFWRDLDGPSRITRGRFGEAGGWLEDVASFDAGSFAISPDEAAAMDPQQRLLLTLAAELPVALRSDAGVFVGAGQSSYTELVRHEGEDAPASALAGNLLSMLAARISHSLDLRGPALTVDTACSAALVALQLAERAIRAGDCSQALVGSVNLNLTPTLHRLFRAANALSPTGRCLPFSAEADGTVPGEGATLLVLEPLSKVDGPILGILRSVAVNNDGSSLGVMSPNPAGQEAVIRRALTLAKISASEVGFVEAHGTGTPVGDAVERAVLGRVYPNARVGAVKSHVGHLMGAAGGAGLLRALALFQAADGARYVSVSSFGFGGTNAHAILERPPVAGVRPPRPALCKPTRHWIGETSIVGLTHAVAPDPAGGVAFRVVTLQPADFLGKRVLVTGGTGAIGRALARALRRAGATVVTLARHGADLNGDVADPSLMFGHFDIGFHLAGSLTNPGHAKVQGWANLRTKPVDRWVLASSISAVVPGLSSGIEAYVEANRALIRAAEGDARCVAVSLAPVSGDGMASPVVEALRTRGVEPLTLRQTVAILMAAPTATVRHLVAMRRVELSGPLPEDLAGLVRALVARAAERAEVPDDVTLGSLGIDSVAALDVLKDLEEAVGRPLPTTLLYENDTVAKIVRALEGATRVEGHSEAEGRILPSQQTFVVQRAFFPDMPGNVLIAGTVDPPLDRADLERAWAAVLDRHPALTAVIRELRQIDGVCRPAVRWQEEGEWEARVAEETFDLEKGPLAWVATDGRRLVVNGHHSVVDAWSQKVVLEDLLAFCAGQALSPLHAGYADVARALRGVAPDLAPWHERFADGVAPLHLAWSAPVDTPSSGGVRSYTDVYDVGLSETLAITARSVEVSLPALVLALYIDRLYAWSGQPDVTVRVAHARREARIPDIERIVGAFADSLPVRIRVTHNEPVEHLARRVQEELAFAADHVGASSMALASIASGGPSGPVGLTPVGFSFPLLPGAATVGGRTLSEVRGAAGAGMTRLTLVGFVFDGRLHLSWNAARSHLSNDRLRAYAADFHASVARLAAERSAQPQTLHQRAVEACRRWPDRIYSGDLTFGELDRRSGQLAARLGAHPHVAVFAAPSKEAAIAVLAVLRAGAAYVPVDPEWPDARIRQILDSAEPGCLITVPELTARAHAFGVPIVPLDGPSCEAVCRSGPHTWVMYTSGSTGVPKGVVVSHRSALVFLEWAEHFLALTPEDRFVGTSSLGYGGSVRQIFAPMLTGGRYCPVPRSIARDPDALLDFLVAEQITIWNSVPSMWLYLVDAAERRAGDAGLGALRWVLVGGEAVPTGLTRRWRARFPGRVVNLYGSTETIVNATFHEVVGELPDLSSVPIGRARGGVAVALVDEVDGVGEIVVGGAIADGYLKNEPGFVGEGAGRRYHTGDLGRRLPDGSLLYVGRSDGQVQVHGNRVELSEIDAVLLAVPGVRAAATVWIDGALLGRDAGFLVAWVEGEPAGDVRAFVASRLPAYMVPHRIEVGILPRNAAGKVDRPRLRAEGAARLGGTFEPPVGVPPPSGAGASQAMPDRRQPADAALALVAAAWRSVLALRDLPAADADFFELGGDSIRALEVLDVLRPALRRDLHPVEVYGAPRLSTLAELVAGRLRPDAGASAANEPRPISAAAPIARGRPELPPTAEGPEAVFPLSSVQRGFWTVHQRRPTAPPTWCACVPVRGSLDLDAFGEALATLVLRHPMLRTVFTSAATSPVQQVLPAFRPVVQYDDLTFLPVDQRGRALEVRFEEELASRFALDRLPLFRARICRLEPDHHVLLLASHHIVSDAWSLWVLAEEIVALHDGRSLPVLKDTFREAVATEMLTDDPWWRSNLGGLTQVAWTPEPETRTARVHLPPASFLALQTVARGRADSPYVLVLEALFGALEDVNGPDDRVISTAIAARPNEMSGVVGPFARGLPVRARRPEDTPSAFRAAFAHSEAPASSVAVAVGAQAMERLGRYFLTWLDPTALPSVSGSLRFDWEHARFRFSTPSTATEAMVSVLVSDGLHIGLTGGALVERLGPALEARLRRMAPPLAVVTRSVVAALVIYPPAGVSSPFDRPVVVERVESALGVSELVLIPSLSGDLDAQVRAAAALTGASVVALAGLLPARTGLGARILTREGQLLTTGHAATVVAMVRTAFDLVRRTGREWAELDVGFLGYGAVGKAVYDLLVSRVTPRSIRIEDPAFPAREPVSGCGMILAATSVGDVLDVRTLPPGTLVVDDSFPRAFDDAAALRRMRERGDVLLVGGGMLDAGPMVRTSPFPQAEVLRAQFPSRWLPGCHAEAVLLAAYPELGPTVGVVTRERAEVVDAAIERAGWKVAPLHLGVWEVPEALIERVRG